MSKFFSKRTSASTAVMQLPVAEMNYPAHPADSPAPSTATLPRQLPSSLQNVSGLPGAAQGLKILIVDDETDIRHILCETLQGLGHEAQAVEDGAKAVALYEESLHAGRAFDLVITDLSIPGGMGGEETMKKLLRIDPKVRAVVSSGLSCDPVMDRYEQYGFKGVIIKPYRRHDLEQLLARLMQS